MSGWIKLHREITDHWIYKDAEIMYFWIRLLMDANFKDNKTVFNGSLITVKRGELIFGLDSYSKKTNISIKKLRRFIKLLEQDGMLGRVKFAKYSVISITNYDKYQEGAGKGQAEGIERASKGQHYKKDNNEKKVKKKPVEIDIPAWLNSKSWSEFEQHRIDIKKPLTNLARTKAINSMEGLTLDQQQRCIDQSIQSRWAGIFPDKYRDTTAQPAPSIKINAFPTLDD